MKIIRQTLNIIKESFKGIYRNFGMGFASTISIAAMLSLFGFIFLIVVSINSSVYHLGSEVDKVVVFIKDDASAEDVNSFIKNSVKDERVKNLKYVSHEEALEDFKEGFGDKANVLDILPENNFPASLVISLKDLSLTKDFAKEISQNTIVYQIKFHDDLVSNMISFERGVKYIGSIVVVVLLLVSILIIHNTIKIAVKNREREINIMKYVGASNSYIRGPFLLEGIIFGIIGALIAYKIVFFGYNYYYELVSNFMKDRFGLDILTPTSIRNNISIIFICMGTGIGYLGSLLSTKRFLDV